MFKIQKIYIRDTEILHWLLQINSYDSLISNAMAGNSWEGYVEEQIISNLNNQCISFYYRKRSGSELDLYIIKRNEIAATFEIQLSNNPKISVGNTESIIDLKINNNFIITFSAGNYALNDKWQFGDLNSIEKHLSRLGLKD